MKIIFILKHSKFYVDFENAIKNFENVDSLKHNCVWSSDVNFCQLWQECMWAGLNVLKSSPNISDRTKRHHKQLNLFDITTELP